MSTMQLTDPFSVKKCPKWHPYRIFYTLRAWSADWTSKATFARHSLPLQEFDGLPECPEAQWDDTAVVPLQLRHLLKCVQLTESLSGTCVVEIGAYRGVTAEILANATGRNYYAVDPYIGYGGSEADLECFQLRSANCPNLVHLRQTSGEAASAWRHGPVGFVFIDAVHDYVNVQFDIAAWSRHMVSGSILALHDTDNPLFPGVRLAVTEVIPTFEVIAHVPDLVVLRKP